MNINIIGRNYRGGKTSFDPSKLPYQALWVANGKKNSDTDKNVPNLVDANNPLVLSNFLYGLGSGYQLFNHNFNDFGNTSLGTGYLVKNSSLIKWTVTADIVNPNAYYIVSNRYTVKPFKVRLTSNRPDLQKTKFRYIRKSELGGGMLREVLLELNEVTEIPGLTSEQFDELALYYPMLTSATELQKGDWVSLEQIPEGEGLFMDGADDSFASKLTLPALSEYTIIGDLAFSSFASSGIGKASNWFWYSNRVWINGTTVSNPYTGKCLGFNSDGLILTENEGAVQGKLSSVAPTETKIASFNSPKMSWGVLAIIKKSLNEQEIRSVYSYLKTLKANNTGIDGTSITYNGTLVTYNNTQIYYGNSK